MTLKQIINTWAKRLWQKLRGKKEEPKYDLYQIPNGPGFFVPKGTTPPQFGKNISIQIPDSRKPIRPPAPPKEKVKADTDGDKVDSMIYGVEAMRHLDLDEDNLKLTKEEIKEVDAKIDRWYKKSPNSTVNGIKDMAEKFKDIQKNPKYHEDISPLLSGAAVSNKEVIDGIANAIREVTKPNKDTKKPTQKKRRKRTNSKKKSGEKK